MRQIVVVILVLCLNLGTFAKDAISTKKLPAHSKVFISPMGGFENELKTAMEKKKVPLEIVTERDKADYEITGTSESQKAGAAKKIVMWDWHSNEQASIKVSDIKSGEIVYSYSANKQSSVHG